MGDMRLNGIVESQGKIDDGCVSGEYGGDSITIYITFDLLHKCNCYWNCKFRSYKLILLFIKMDKAMTLVDTSG